MQLVDSWRLFGPNLQTRGPATLAEVSFDPGDDVPAAIAAWRGEVDRMAAAVGRSFPDTEARVYRGGAVLTFSAPTDVLLPATDLNEWAATSAARIVRGEGALPLEPRRTELAAAFREKTRPDLLALEAEALARGVPFLWDDERVTVGAGKGSLSWPMPDAPRPSDVDWGRVSGVPLALVTGTNGKTTSVRLLARMLKRAGHVVGMTTTDGVWIDERLALAGDYTGPAGALHVLRDPTVEAAVLETARGGILRRGLAVRHADVALLTNVSDDHLGHYGVDDLASLARVKAVTASVVAGTGRVVVNADDPHLLAALPDGGAPRVLFGLDPASAPLVAHRAGGGEAWTVRDGTLVRGEGDGAETAIARVADLAFAFGGAAPYNVANALGAAAAAHALGVPDATIGEALTRFLPAATDNPGRGNLRTTRGVSVLVDFAHNPDGIRSVLGLVARLRAPGGRLAVVAGYAGDRSDESIHDAARAIHDAEPSLVVLRDLDGYLRGRQPGEVPTLFRRALLGLGLPPSRVCDAPSEGLALRRALAWARPGDFVVILAHLESAEVDAVLAEGAGA
jgi:UDP-N-acetylmuramyl tripeptide synthase